MCMGYWYCLGSSMSIYNICFIFFRSGGKMRPGAGIPCTKVAFLCVHAMPIQENCSEVRDILGTSQPSLAYAGAAATGDLGAGAMRLPEPGVEPRGLPRKRRRMTTKTLQAACTSRPCMAAALGKPALIFHPVSWETMTLHHNQQTAPALLHSACMRAFVIPTCSRWQMAADGRSMHGGRPSLLI